MRKSIWRVNWAALVVRTWARNNTMLKSSKVTHAGGIASVPQTEVMERLKQLMAWQESQKANLLRQQQVEIIRLQKEQGTPERRKECNEERPADDPYLHEVEEDGVEHPQDSAGITKGQTDTEQHGQQHGNTPSKNSHMELHRVSTPSSLVRCSSEESFVTRRDHRLEVEEEELLEFETLERVADMSLLSQLSLIYDDRIESPKSRQPVAEPDNSHHTSTPYNTDAVSSQNYCPANLSSSDANDDDDDPGGTNLDDTLKYSPSLAKGVEFNDEEAWESFSHSPQSRCRAESSGSDTTLPNKSPTRKIFRKSPVNEDSYGDGESSDAVSPDSAISSRQSLAQFSEPETFLQSSNHHSLNPNMEPPSKHSFSRPSSLISKLFPAIAPIAKAPVVDIPSPVSSSGGDSGVHSSTSMSISEDFKSKLNQLEEEIKRYTFENTSLDKLRKEREEDLAHLRREIAEFAKQKDEEMARFEEYKKEEMNKIKKERKVFESYKLEAKAARNRKDKEDIENLRNELLVVREDLKNREAHWGATLSRYRLKIESLEAENKELQEDLRMMEQERLLTWQMQVEEELAKKRAAAEQKAPSPPPSPEKTPPPLPACSVIESKATPIMEPEVLTTKHEVPSVKYNVPVATQSLFDAFEPKVQALDASKVQEDGSKVLTFSNGTRKIVSADGKSTSVYFFNGDVKHVKPDRTVVYYYSEFKITQTNYQDGLVIVEFPNQQCEKQYPNGTKEIHFPNDTVKYIYPNGEEESIFPDGLSQHNYPNGDVTLHMPNGIKEFHTKKFKRREYPDGTIKTVYPDGKQETHYSSGRVKIKDKNGRVISDGVATMK